MIPMWVFILAMAICSGVVLWEFLAYKRLYKLYISVEDSFFTSTYLLGYYIHKYGEVSVEEMRKFSEK